MEKLPLPPPLSIRVYYEDTDAGGVVYYANYLKYLERCRTEWLRAIGHDQSELLKEHNLAFMVRKVNADYLQPARLDDVLSIDLQVEKLGGAQIIFLQNIRCTKNNMTRHLLTAHIQIVCVNTVTMKPMPIPGWMKDKLRSLI